MLYIIMVFKNVSLDAKTRITDIIKFHHDKVLPHDIIQINNWHDFVKIIYS